MRLSKPAFDKCSNCNFAAFQHNANKLHNSENKYSYYTPITMSHNLVPDVRCHYILVCPGKSSSEYVKGPSGQGRSARESYPWIGLGFFVNYFNFSRLV
jgi:hypothetical protein